MSTEVLMKFFRIPHKENNGFENYRLQTCRRLKLTSVIQPIGQGELLDNRDYHFRK